MNKEQDINKIKEQLTKIHGWQSAVDNKLIDVKHIIEFLQKFPEQFKVIEALIVWVNTSEEVAKNKAFIDFILSFGVGERSLEAICDVLHWVGSISFLNIPVLNSSNYSISYDYTYYKKIINSKFLEEAINYLDFLFSNEYGYDTQESLELINKAFTVLISVRDPNLKDLKKIIENIPITVQYKSLY